MEQGKILLVGEAMGLLMAREKGSLASVHSFQASLAGAELNVAIGLSRLGKPVTFLTKVGIDSFGKRIEDCLSSNHIDSQYLQRMGEASSGFMLKSKVERGDPEIEYYRKGSAASTLSIPDICGLDWATISHIHFTGIFPALSSSTRETVFFLKKRAKEAGVFLSFDPNLRLNLWKNEEEMIEVLEELAEGVDLVLPGVNEGKVLTGSDNFEKIAAFYFERGCSSVIIKAGNRGAFAAERTGGRWWCPAYFVNAVVDTVGAGDGFAVGVLSALYEGLSLKEATVRGNAVGAMQVQQESDNEGLPTKEELDQFINETPFQEG